jgi:hypothetical protein
MTGELCDEVSIGKMMNVIFLLMGSERQDRACAIGISHVVCNLTFLWVHPSLLPRDQPWRSGVYLFSSQTRAYDALFDHCHISLRVARIAD